MKRFLKWAAVVLVAGVVAEQSFLYFYLNKIVLLRDEEFREFIEKVKSEPGGLSAIRLWRCEYHSLGNLPYEYQMCIYDSRTSLDGSDFPVHFFRVQKPAALISLIPRRYSDRLAFDGVFIFAIDNNGNIVRDFRINP